jgi:alpha-beta hydrolase superfamily lysophospholipase
MKKILFFLLVCATSVQAQLDGLWHSSFQVAGKSLLMDLDIKGVGRDGSVSVIIPDQPQMKPQEMAVYSLFIDSLYFRWDRIGLSFAGKLKNDSLKGIMKQSGLEWDVVFTKTEQERIEVSGRPQDPVGPFSYEEKELEIKNKNIKIAGTLTLPKEGNFPIVILVSGSGQQDRDCELVGHKPFWILADYLSKNGIGVFRYDDRGIGKSTGEFGSSTETDFTSDLLSVFTYLKKKYPGHPIGIYGHSEGGIIGLRAAAQQKEIRFLIESASVGTNGKDVLVNQQYDIPIASGMSEEEAKWNSRLFEEAANIVLKKETVSFLKDYENWLGTVWEKLPSSFKEDKSMNDMATEMSVFINTDWAKEFLSYQAADYLKTVDLPILILNGKKDIQVRWNESQTGFKNAMNVNTLRQSTFKAYDDLNHLLQPCIKCNITEYATIETSMSPIVMSDILTWVKSFK